MKSGVSRHDARGVAILELMLALVIGLVVVGAVLVTFLGSGRTSAAQNAYSQMNDDAQIALNILTRDLQLAGYAQPTGVSNGKFERSSLLATAVFGCDYRFSGSMTASTAVCPTAQPTSALENMPSIQIVYEADTVNTPPSSQNKPTDCLGRGLDAPVSGASYPIAVNRYYVSAKGNDPTKRRELYCASNGGTPQPIVENVESIQFWYGMGATDNPKRVARYLSASDVTMMALGGGARGTDIGLSVGGVGLTGTVAGLALPSAGLSVAGIKLSLTPTGSSAADVTSAWDKVVSVRVCVVMRSAEPILTAEDSPTYRDCNGNLQTGSVPAPSPADPTDSRYLRRAYFTTVSLRNKTDF